MINEYLTFGSWIFRFALQFEGDTFEIWKYLIVNLEKNVFSFDIGDDEWSAISILPFFDLFQQ